MMRPDPFDKCTLNTQITTHRSFLYLGILTAVEMAQICKSNTEHSSLLDTDGRKISNNAREIKYSINICVQYQKEAAGMLEDAGLLPNLLGTEKAAKHIHEMRTSSNKL